MDKDRFSTFSVNLSPILTNRETLHVVLSQPNIPFLSLLSGLTLPLTNKFFFENPFKYGNPFIVL